MQDGDVPQTWADVTKLEKLGYKSSIDIKEGVEQFVNRLNIIKNIYEKKFNYFWDKA